MHFILECKVHDIYSIYLMLFFELQVSFVRFFTFHQRYGNDFRPDQYLRFMCPN